MCLRSSGIPWIKLSLFSFLLKFPMTLFEHTVCQWPRFTVSQLAPFSPSRKSRDQDPRPTLAPRSWFLGFPQNKPKTELFFGLVCFFFVMSDLSSIAERFQ